MREYSKIIAACVLLTAVLLVFVRPLIDLPPTALRAKQAASLLYWMLVFGVLLAIRWILTFRRPVSPVVRMKARNRDEYLTKVYSDVDLACSRLC